ncbi:MAG: uL30 family ribosomal protein [Candidatus Micrarchaeaceae archaeon]
MVTKKDIENKLLAVIRVRGRANIRRSISDTLNRLRLKRVNNLVLVFGQSQNIGMIRKCADYVAYGEIDKATLNMLNDAKGLGLNEEKIDALLSGKVPPSEVLNLPIGMKPPKHGYKSIKRSVSDGGSLGYSGAGINNLIKRML